MRLKITTQLLEIPSGSSAMRGVTTIPMSTDAHDKSPFQEAPLPHDDLAFVRAALGGDSAAIEFLAKRAGLVPRVLSDLNRRWGRPLTEQDIEDLSQDVVLFVLQKLEAYHGLSPFDAWLYRFCSLQMRNRVRREVFRRRVVRNEEADPAVQTDTSDQIDGQSMWQLVEELDPADREIMRAKHSRGLSFTEIGEQQGAAPSSIKTRYYRSLDLLRMRIKSQHGQGEES